MRTRFRFRFRFISTFLLVLLMLMLAACSGQPQPAVSEPAQTDTEDQTTVEEPAEEVAEETEPIIIGAVFNATGWMAAYDQPPREGALLAVKAINEAGGVLGRPLELIELDGNTDPATVGNATRQLIEQGADVIIAPCDFDIGGPASQAAQEAGLVGVSTCATSPLYGSDALGDKQFSLAMWNNIMSAAAAEYAYNDLGWRTAYVVADTSIDYSLSLGEYFTEHFQTLGGEIVGEDTYLQGDADFSAQIQRIEGLETEPDGLFISSYSPDLGTIIRQTRAAGIETPIMGGDTYDDSEFWAVVGDDLANDIYFATHGWLGEGTDPATAAFVELYEAEYGQSPATAFIVTGWDTVQTLAQAIKTAGSTDGAAVAKVMEETEFDLLSGNLDWTPAAEGHLPVKEVAIVELQGGKPGFKAWVRPASFPDDELAPAPNEDVADAEPAAEPSGEPITIGAIFNATGWMAAYDQPPREGALLAVEAINEAGGVLGRPLELIELDGNTDPATVGNAARQLIEQGADVILAPCDFDIGGPASQAAQEVGLVGLSTCASSPLYGSAALGDKQFTLAMWNNIMSAAAAEYAYNELGWRSAYVVADTSIDYSLSLGDYFTEHFQTLGGEIVGEDTYLQGDADFSAQIQRIQGLDTEPDGLYIASYSPDLGTIIRQTRAAGIETPIMGGDTYDDSEFWAVVGDDLANDIYYVTHGWVGQDADEATQEFIDRYQAKYNQPPGTAFILTGWDAVYVLAQAIEEAGTTEGAAVATAMEETEFDLLSGQLDWQPAAEGHQPVKAAAVAVLQGGQPSFLQWVLPDTYPEP